MMFFHFRISIDFCYNLLNSILNAVFNFIVNKRYVSVFIEINEGNDRYI